VSRRIWKAVEAKVGKTRVAKRGEGRGRGKETRREGAEKTKKKRTMEVKKVVEE